ncbi:AEL227Cp [Eremothecium gossypii ATCC 10895]|uniref:AEL227Cp n=1 Tax=Eremothecium gossypii (strain ATCC 10895 / CBS 109.51 / FGSC 9923 / NRRL Y-1056) TaxID=284811 RepID=Q758I9_EREGS|nr:AEL227Cp [Eremothecium gossypii ATCC 10895]AAS52458.2 AEL227Cp [Eremothecium gossypii ATCC 10895]
MDSLRGHHTKERGSGHGRGECGVMQGMLLDKMMEKVLGMAIPPAGEAGGGAIESRVQAGRARPGLSVPIMSRNFVQMNSRLSFPFQVVNEVIRIANWESTACTLSVGMLYSFVVLRPLVTLSSAPMFYILFAVMVPYYMQIHAPEPWEELGANPIPAAGPALKEPDLPRPVPELSKEFILNLTDLQNHMVLYVVCYDFITGLLAKFAFFADENVSAAAFVGLLVLGVFNMLFIESLFRWIPLKLLLLACGWGFLIMLHPSCRDACFDYISSEETRLKVLTMTNKIEQLINDYWDYCEPRETRQAAIFEIQKFDRRTKEWRTAGFSSDDYTLLSKLRIAEEPIDSSATSLDDVKPPLDWKWLGKYDWVLDLEPRQWVTDGFVQYVDIDAETKWVYDLNFDGTRGQYRRRRWIRLCTRNRSVQENANVDTIDDDNSDDYELVDYSGCTGVSQNSMHGSVKSCHSISEPTDQIVVERLRSHTLSPAANASVSSADSTASATIATPNKNVEQGSRAIKSLTDFLNING